MGFRRLRMVAVPVHDAAPRWPGLAALVIHPVVVAMLGCGHGDQGRMDDSIEPAEFSRHDSAGIVISSSSGVAARSPLAWEVEVEPELVLGAGNSRGEYLHRVQGVKGLPGNRVLVVDGGSQELRFYDAEGRLVKRAGGSGEGPGEFRDPVLVPLFGKDSLLLFDKMIPRFQVLAEDGAYGRGIRHVRGWPSGRVPPLGAKGDRVLFRGSGSRAHQSDRPREGLVINDRWYFWYDPFSGDTIHLAVFQFDSYQTREVHVAVPFRALPSATVGRWGALVTDGRAPEIRVYDTEGHLVRVFRVEEARRPVTRAMLDRRFEIESAGYPPESPMSRQAYVTELYGPVPVPDSLPVFQTLMVDELGWLWAGVYDFDPARPREWVVFDEEGRAHGTVRTPPGLEVQWIGRDAILGVWKDEFGVEYVHRHRLTRAPPPRGAGEAGEDRQEGGASWD